MCIFFFFFCIYIITFNVSKVSLGLAECFFFLVDFIATGRDFVCMDDGLCVVQHILIQLLYCFLSEKGIKSRLVA